MSATESLPSQTQIITAANLPALLAAVRACIGQKVAVIYKNTPAVGTFMQLEGELHAFTDNLTLYVAGAGSIARFTEFSITGFVPAGQPVTASKLPVIYIR